LNVTPSQPQYVRRSRVQARAFAEQVPGSASVQPCPSQTPELQLAPSKHGWPSARSVPPAADAPPAVSGAGGVVSVGVACSPVVGGAGGGEPLDAPEQATVPAISATITTFSNSLWRMPASYTLRDE
jgi:hypothetical protein